MSHKKNKRPSANVTNRQDFNRVVPLAKKMQCMVLITRAIPASVAYLVPSPKDAGEIYVLNGEPPKGAIVVVV